MGTIFCNCGNEIEKDFDKAMTLLDSHGDIWCVWVCRCGQEFKERTKEAITLGSRTPGIA